MPIDLASIKTENSESSALLENFKFVQSSHKLTEQLKQIKKLNIKSIGELKIPVLDIEKQRQIGRLYRQSIIQKDLLERQAANINRLMIETIRKMEEN